MRLRTFNNLLSVVVIGLGLYLVLSPWLPNLDLWWRQRQQTTPAYAQNLTSEQPVPTGETPALPLENRLVIPKIALDSEIYEGKEWALSQGPWRRPQTSTPDRGGNTVIAGHRFAYGSNGKWIFYHLDKLKQGDRIGVYWQQKEYVYEVSEIVVVEPTALEVEAATNDSRLTLYTCTPLLTADKRLVVIARLIGEPSDD